MSLAVKTARATTQGARAPSRPMGDPGLLGGILGGIGGFLTGGPVGAVTGAISGFTGRGSGPPAPPGRRPPLVNPPFAGPPGIGIGGPVRIGIGERMQTNGAAGGKAPPGYHWNKSDYFLRDGTFVPKGTRLVKNRSKNAMNPRALSRAISRVNSAKRWQSKLSEIATGKYTASGKKKSC